MFLSDLILQTWQTDCWPAEKTICPSYLQSSNKIFSVDSPLSWSKHVPWEQQTGRECLIYFPTFLDNQNTIQTLLITFFLSYSLLITSQETFQYFWRQKASAQLGLTIQCWVIYLLEEQEGLRWWLILAGGGLAHFYLMSCFSVLLGWAWLGDVWSTKTINYLFFWLRSQQTTQS